MKNKSNSSNGNYIPARSQRYLSDAVQIEIVHSIKDIILKWMDGKIL